MEKIKNVLSGHKKGEDATHDPHTTSSTTDAHTEGQPHPIYDEMTGKAEPTSTTGTTTSAGQMPTTSALGKTEQAGTTTTHGSVVDSQRPGASTLGTGHANEGMSEASIKSGVIGFGNGQQGHAAMPSRNPVEDNLQRNQVVGGGDDSTGVAEKSAPAGVASSVPHSTPAHKTDDSAIAPGASAQESSAHPFDKTLRQESYTADTDRSFPLAGGVAPKHGTHDASSARQPDATTTPVAHPGNTAGVAPSTSNPVTSEREPGTKEKEAGVRDGHGREGLAAAAGAAAIAAPLAYSKHEQKDVPHQGQETRQATYGNQPATTGTTGATPSTGTTQNVHPEALAAARAAAAKSAHDETGTAGTVAGSRPAGQRTDSRPHIPGEFPSPTPDESRTFLYYRDNLVPEPGANTHLTPGHHGAHDQTVAPVGDATTSTATDKSIPTALAGQHSGVGGTTASTSNDALGQHELRHTGTLEEPRPRSSEHEDHTGRNAALAGGLAGAAGLGYAASKHHDHSGVASDNASPYSSTAIDPRVMGNHGKLDEQRFDPQAKATDSTTHHALQTSNPAGITPAAVPAKETTAATGPVHDSSLLNKVDPRVHEKSSKPIETKTADPSVSSEEKDSDHHYGRDAALIGGGAAAAAGVHHQLQRNDTPGTGTAVLPQDSANPVAAPVTQSSAPVSSTAPISSTAPTSTQSAAPVAAAAPAVAESTAPVSSVAPTSTKSSAPVASDSSATEPTSRSEVKSSLRDGTYQGPSTTSGTQFYGNYGAPAPLADDKSKSSAATKEDHHGRDAALAGGAAAGLGGLAYASQHDNKAETGPASKTIGPHSSNVANVLDPRVKPDPSQQAHHQAGSTTSDPASRTVGPHDSNIANIVDPRVQPDPAKQKAVDPKTGEKDHHYGRDAAIVGGTGAAGYGAYEAAKAYGDHRSTQPGAAMAEQRYDPMASGAHAPNPMPASGHYDYNNEATARNVNEPALGHHDATKDHSNRNAALGATAGAAALGGTAYASSKHGEHSTAASQPMSGTSQPMSGAAQPAVVSQSQPGHGFAGEKTSAAPTAQDTAPGVSHNRYDSVQQHPDDHTKRNAALAGAGGAAAAGSAYAYSQHHDAEKERERLEKDQQAHDKEQKKLDKEHEKEQKKLDKEHAKQEKEAHKLEKEREKEGEPEKKHSILGFLHRDKTKKEKHGSSESSPRQSGEARRTSDSPRHSKEYAAAGAAAGAGAVAAAAHDSDHSGSDSPRWKGKNKLHKDPPKGHPAHDALAHHGDTELTGGKREHMGVDGPIGRPDAISGYTETRTGVYGAQPLNEVPENNKVIEPHTGLPMNIGRFGDGTGGTDANPTVVGHHTIPGVDDNLRTGHGTTNWEEVRKANTPY